MIEERYRSDYSGEFVVTNARFKNGKKQLDREWVDNPIKNQHISGRAAVIASGESRLKFNVSRLQTHRGGLLGSKQLQTYGTGQLHKEMKLNFFVTYSKEKLEECIASDYVQHSVVYTSSRNCVAYPSQFYLIPYSLALGTGPMAVWLAAFDNHKEIFMLGFDNQIDPVYNNNIYVDSGSSLKTTPPPYVKNIEYICQIMTAFKSTRFIRVSGWDRTDQQTPDEWKWCPNFDQMTYKEWISYCDV